MWAASCLIDSINVLLAQTEFFPFTIIAFYLVMPPPPNTRQDEAGSVSVPSDQDQALESMCVDAFHGIFQY